MFDSSTPTALPKDFADKAEWFVAGLTNVEQEAGEPLATLARQTRERSAGVLTGGAAVDLNTVLQFMNTNRELIGSLFTQASANCEPDNPIQISFG